jgi:hypothetical protein
MVDHKTDYYRQREAMTNILVNALLDKYREVTGKQPSDKLYDELYEVLRFDNG